MHSVLLDTPSPDQLHSNFAQAANGAAQAIKQFSQLLEDSRTKEVMENAKQGRRENSEGIIGWQVAEHEDWLDVKQEDGNDDADKEERDNTDAGDDASLSNVTATLDKFRSTHVGVDVSMDKDLVTVSRLHALIRAMLKSESLFYLRQLKSISKFSWRSPPKAVVVMVSIAKSNPSFTERLLRRSGHGPSPMI